MKLREIECAKSNPESLRNTVNLISNISRQLENLGVDIDNGSMKMDIISKLPDKESEELKWLLISDPENATMNHLIKKMKDLTLRAELAPKKKPFTETKSTNNYQPNIPKPDTNFEPAVKAGKIKCNLCDDPHFTSKCPKYISVDDKIKQLRIRNFCTKCSGRNHAAESCFAKILCHLCKGNHHTCLCKTNGSTRSSAFITVERKHGMLLTKDVTIINPLTKETTDTVVIFDSGSQQSYVSNEIMEQLKLEKLQDEKIQVVGFGAKSSSYTSSLIKFNIKTKVGDKLLYANSTKQIATTVPVVYAETFESIDIKTVYKTPEILIGMDYFFEFITSFEKISDNLYIVDSIVGKMLCKNIPKNESSTVASLAIESPQKTDDENDLQKFWNLENMGIKDSETNEEETAILEKFKENVKFKDNRYYVSWPEKEIHDKLPTNAALALGRLNSNFKRLSNDPKLLNDCGKIVEDQVKRGTVEVAPDIPEGDIVHYLSSHAVVTPQKTTTKVRMVFDASARISKNAPCLNDILIRGPLNVPDLGGILLRIRRGKYMLIGDIEKAFHQIYLNEKDRDAVRFFWAKDPTKPLTKDNLIIYRFVGVPFGVISSPFILWIIILLHLQKLNDERLRNIVENFYVDNIFLLVDDTKEAVEQFKTIRNHFLQASMNIREWLSNNPTINEIFPNEIRQKNTVTKVLGLNWDSEADILQIELKNDLATKKWTKREILKFIASTFDPLGFLSPVTVKGRIYLQKIFKEKLTWDESLNGNLLNQWESILKDWNGIINVPRKYVENKFPDNTNIEIHAFADASQQAYCTCIYLRIKTENGYETPLVFAKSRLQPLNKRLTIPKLEIMGIWLAGKLIIYVSKQLKLENCERFIWTDSQISYYWFQKYPKDVFVTNRLKEVLQSNATCYFIPGDLNPADLGTRGITFDELERAKSCISCNKSNNNVTKY
uniref:Reverse transcriptase domain-containing protein n=1 Tax=Panagrolaimus superbus TaxID=310955 RepID=A0A914YQH3_9BILA